MQRIKDIQTPKTLDQFRANLKKFCLGSKNNIFIFNKADGRDYKVDVEKISKISDVVNLIETQSKQSIFLDDVNIILMCDSSHIEASKLMMKEEDAIMLLKEV